MKKQLHFSRATKNAFLIPLLVATLLILGVVVYATLGGTEIRSKAASYAKCMLPTKTGAYGRLTCKSGYFLQGNLCCPPSIPTPTPIRVTLVPTRVPTPTSIRRPTPYPTTRIGR